MNTEIKYIVITGVESSGKSTLSKALAQHFNEPLVPEMARAYLAAKESYGFEDIEAIARLQWAEIEKKSTEAKKYLFIDTAFLVLKIWSEEKYGRCCRFILDKLATFTPDLYLLAAMDIPYEQDVLRETPDVKDRERLYALYLAHVVGERFVVVEGEAMERLQQAVSIVASS